MKTLPRINKKMPKQLIDHIKMLKSLKVQYLMILGEWYDATKVKPPVNGKYIAILETKSPNHDSQSWAGIGEPEIVSYNDNYDTSPLNNWTSRGSLTVAYWSKLPEFRMTWVKNHFGKGVFVETENDKLLF